MHPVETWLEEDHRRLEGLLDRAVADIANVDMDLYTEFRKGLLRHISMEERILIPAIRALRASLGQDPHFEQERQIRLDHGAIGTLLVLPPTPFAIASLRGILTAHNPLEEGDSGLYAEVRSLSAEAVSTLMDELMAIPMPPLSPYMNSADAYEPARRAMTRAGHDPDGFPAEQQILRRDVPTR